MGNAFFVVVVVALVIVPLAWFALRTTCPNCGKWVRRRRNEMRVLRVQDRAEAPVLVRAFE
jgi:hypothetical protein